MAEQDPKQNPKQEPQGPEPRTFTQEEVNELMGKVRREVTGKFPDYEELKKKAAVYDEAQEKVKTELEKAQEAAAKANEELSALRAEKARNDLAAKVSAATGVPASLITGGDEESMTASANAIAAFARAASTTAPLDKGGAAKSQPQSEEGIRSMANPLDRVAAYARQYEERGM